jgi:hypothetical protein
MRSSLLRMSSERLILSWEDSEDKKVKTSEGEELGKIKSIGKEYIEVEDGLVAKKKYFIPKYFVQGYDGNHIWISLIKEVVRERFEREESPKDMSEFETPDYVERRESIKTLYPDFEEYIPRYAPVPGASTTTVRAPPSTKAVTVFWDNLKGKKVKSNDDDDVGKVEVIGPHYVEVKEGLIGKKHYFIPKYYFESYDGEKLHVSLSKDEIKEKWERDNPPLESEVETQAYLERKKKVDEEQPQFVNGIPLLAPEPGVTLRSDATGEEINIEWANVIHKHVRASDDVDIGDVERVGDEFFVVRQGVAKVHLYYVPKASISNYDGSYLYLNVPSDFAKTRFERDTEPTSEEVRALAKETKTQSQQKSVNASTKKKESQPEPGTRKDDSLTSYTEKEPMTPAKIKEHEPTAVKREMTEKIVEPGRTGTNSQDAAEVARKKGMAKGTAGASETGSKYEQGAAGTDQ